MSITRRVAMSAVKQLFKLVSIPQARTLVTFNGDARQAVIFDSTVNKFVRYQRDMDNRSSASMKLTVELREESSDEHNNVMTTHYEDWPPVFDAPQIGLYMKPIYDKTKLTLSFNFRSENREILDRLRADLRHYLAEGRMAVPIEVQYYMLLPDAALAMIRHCWELQEKQAGYGESWETFIAKYSGKHLKQITNLIGKNATFAFEERQRDVVGIFEFTTIPEKEKRENGANYGVTFDFTVLFDKPIEFITRMPLVVHNQLIHKAFQPKPPYDIGRLPAYRSQLRIDADTLWKTPIRYLASPNANPRATVCYPEFDEWEIKARQRPHGSFSLIESLIQVDPTDLSKVVNLYDFEKLNLCGYSDNLKKYFRYCHQYLCDQHESVVFFTLYEGSKRLPPDFLYVDIDGNIRTKTELDLRKVYHLRMGFLIDWRQLSEDAVRRLLSLSWIFDEFLKFLHPDVEIKHDRGWMEDWLQAFYAKYGRYPTDEEIERYWRHLTEHQRREFFGRTDEKALRELMKRGLIDPQQDISRFLLQSLRHVGFFWVEAQHQGV